MSSAMNPFDPKTPLYQGQAPQGPPPPAPQPPSLHFLEGLGNLVLAGAHFFSGNPNEETEEEEQRPRRRPRFPRAGGSSSARAGSGSCCRRPTK